MRVANFLIKASVSLSGSSLLRKPRLQDSPPSSIYPRQAFSKRLRLFHHIEGIEAAVNANAFCFDAKTMVFTQIFYRYFNGYCSQEIRDIIPVPLRRARTTRSSTHSHPFQVSLPTSRTLSHKLSFIPRACNLWNILPSSCFHESYNLPSFKSKINQLDLISPSSQPFAFSFLHLLGLCIGHHSLSST